MAEKQAAYSRLYFLSDTQILSLMSSLKPNTEMPISAVFPGVDSVVIDGTTFKAVHRDGQQLQLLKPLSLRERTGYRSVEDWLQELEQGLRNTQAARLMQQIQAFSAETWTLRGDREVLYIAYLVWFTTQINTALTNEDGKNRILALVATLQSNLESCLKSLRPKGGVPGRPAAGLVYSMFGIKDRSLDRANELMVCSLLHHLDWLHTVLSADPQDWEVLWRPYFKLSAVSTGNEVKECLAVTVSCMDYETSFAFEMHPVEASSLFIFTPASEHCLLHTYLTLKHGLSVLLAGASGVGKTETFTHLSVLCGRFLHTSYTASMESFEVTMKSLIGCALGGYWVCFDDVHSLPEMYISTLAHYIRVIQTAFEPDPVRVTIEGVTVRPKFGFAVFATTGTQCSSPFRDLFRCIDMPSPDLRVMCDVLLQTYGLERKYSALICRALEMLAEQPILSVDCRVIRLNTKAGIRTLLRLVKAMLNLCQRFALPDMPYLINNAFRKVYGLGLLPRELKVLDEFLATLFASRHNDMLSLSSLKSTGDAVTEVLIDPKLVCQEIMQRRCQHLLALLSSYRPWIFVLGGPLTGKSLVVTEVAKATSYLKKRNFMVHRLGLGTAPQQLAELFEHLNMCADPIQKRDFQAKFHSTPTGLNVAKYSQYDWIVLDSPSLPCNLLPSLRKSRPNSTPKLLVETENLSGVSPDMVSEAGLLYLEDQDMDTLSFYKVALEQVVPSDLSVHQQSLEDMFESILKPALAYVERAERTVRLGMKAEILLVAKLLKPHLDLLNKHLQRQAGTSVVPIKNAPLVLLKRSKTLVRPQKQQARSTSQEMNVATTLMSYLGSVRKQFKQLEPQLCLEAVYISSVATALGNLITDVWGLHRVIKDLLASKNQEYAYFLYKALEDMPELTLLDLRFSLKEMKWLPALEGVEEVQGPTFIGPSVFEIAGAGLSNLESHQNLESVVIPTPSMLRLRYWANFCLRNHVDIVVCGPHQSGKTSIVMSVAKDLLKKNFSGLVALNLSEYTSYRSVQASIQSSLEHIKPWEYGGLGGTHYYAVLDDMNMDAPNGLYDLLRFWKDTSGWYSEGFTTVSSLTTALIHSYSIGKSRPMWERALRHFVVLHKDRYSSQEVTEIFTTFITAASGPDLAALTDKALAVFTDLYAHLSQRKTEELWCHSSLSNFCGALQFLAHFQQFEDVDERIFSQLLSFTCDRFFTQQFPPADLREAITSKLTQILEEPIAGLLLPNEDQEMWELTSTRVADFVAGFRASYKECISLYPQYLKNLHGLFFDAERRLGSFYYFYLNTMFDIQSSCASVIVRADSHLFLTKALLLIAANALKVKLFDLNIADREDYMSCIQETFHGVSPLHISTELKFQLKRVIEDSMVQNKRVVLVFTLFDSHQLDLPVGRRLLEVANDIISGVKLRLSGFTDVYKDVLDKYQQAHPEASQGMFNDEMLQMLLDRMRRNVTVFFLVSSKDEAWIRSPLHPVGLFEKFKHRYRQLFNKSRVLDFDHLQPPESLVKALSQWVPEWHLHYHNELLLQLGKEVQDCALGTMEEFTYECIIHCSKRLLTMAEAERSTRHADLHKACQQISELEALLEQIPALMQEYSSLVHSQQQQLTTALSQLRAAETYYDSVLAEDYAATLGTALNRRRTDLQERLLAPRQAWESAVLQFHCTPEQLKETEKAASVTPTFAVFYRLLTGDTRESEENAAKRLIISLSKRNKDSLARLRRIEASDILNHLNSLRELERLPTAKFPLERDIRRLLELAVLYGLAVSQCNIDLAQLEEESESIALQVEQRRQLLTAERDSKLEQLKAEVGVAEVELQAAHRQQEQILQAKPVVMRLVLDLRTLAEDWISELKNDKAREEDFGNSLLAAFLLLKGLQGSQSTRAALLAKMQEILTANQIPFRPVSLAELLQVNFALFTAECSVQTLPEAKLMYDNVAALKAIQALHLPTPVIYDPYDIAQDYITCVEGGKGLVVGTVTNEPAFEQGLKNCILKGLPVLCIDPSASLIKVLLPVLKWKSQSYVAEMRGLEVRPLQMLGKLSATVHPDFRLYICVKVLPSAEVLDLATLLSFDASDQETWEAFTSLPLLKLLDAAQYDAHLNQRSKAYQQTQAIALAEKELLDLLTRQDLKILLTNEDLLESFVHVWRKFKNLPLDEDTPIKRRGSVLFLKIEHRLPRDKLRTVLGELFLLKRAMETCAPLLKDFAVPAKVLHAMIECGCAEYIRYIALPLESQWDAFAECLGYRVFIRTCHALSNEKRQVFTSFYVLYKHFQTISDKSQFFSVMNHICQSLDAAMSLSEREDFLQANYPYLFSSTFRPGTAAYLAFLTKPLYSEAKAPSSLSPLLKYLLYAYLRPELLPEFVRHLGGEVLGHRYSWVPKTDYSIYTGDLVRLPTVIFYEQSNPILYLQHLAESRRVTLVRTKPVSVTNMRALAGTRSIGKYVDSIISVLSDNLVSSRWVTIENIDTVAGLEAEVLTKFLLYYIPQHVSDTKKIWVVLQGTPDQYPQWISLVKHCQRIVMLEPDSLKEHMLLWHYTDNGEFFQHYRNSITQQYYAHCSLEGQAPQLPFQLKDKSKVTGLRSLSEKQQLLKYQFNVAFLMSTIYLRNEIHEDLAPIWERRDAKKIANELQTLNVTRSIELRQFCALIGPNLDPFATSTLCDLAQTFLSNQTSLEFHSITYPLFRVETTMEEVNLETLITAFPAEDHLLVTGLHPVAAKERKTNEAKIFLLLMKQLHKSLGGSLDKVDYEEFKASEKSLLAESLKKFLKELYQLPAPEWNSDEPREFRYTDIYLSKEGGKNASWLLFSKDGYRVEDKENSILQDSPSLDQVLKAIQYGEQQASNAFLQLLRGQVRDLYKFLAYRRSAVSPEGHKVLLHLAKDQVPTQWRELSPYLAQQTESAAKWQHVILSKYTSSRPIDVLDLSMLFQPGLALMTILRLAALKAKCRVEKFGFEVLLQSRESTDLRVAGLYLSHAEMNSASGSLEDSEEGTVLPPLSLRPSKTPAHLRKSFPEGHKVVVLPVGEETSLLEFVYCPLVFTQPKFWVLFPAKLQQGYWSRKGVKVDLRAQSDN